MKFIKPSHEPWYPTEPLKDIERAARISYASEGQISETSAKPLVDKLFTREHMTPFEFVTFKFKTKLPELVNRLIYINQLYEVQGDLMCIRIEDIIYISCNLRTLINISKFDTKLVTCILIHYPELSVYFTHKIDHLDFKYINDVKYITTSNFPIELDYQTVKFVTNRGVSHELVRHRKAGFIEKSTRYVKANQEDNDGFEDISFIKGNHINDKVIGGSWDNESLNLCKKGEFEDDYKPTQEEEIYLDSLMSIENSYIFLTEAAGHKWSLQKARAILPNDTMTEIVMIARHWSWKHFFKLRTASGAHPDMRVLVQPCYEEFKSKWPEYYDTL